MTRAEDWIFTAPATEEELELNRAVEQAALDHQGDGPPGEGWIAFADEHPPRQEPFPAGRQRITLFSPKRDGKVWPKVFREWVATVQQQLNPRGDNWFGVTYWKNWGSG